MRELNSRLSAFHKELVKDEVVAVSLCGPGVWYGLPDMHQFLVLMRNLPAQVKYESQRLGDFKVKVLRVDLNAFKKDLKRESFGGFLIEHVISPYEPIYNSVLLRQLEISAKERIAKDALVNLTLEYVDLTSEILIDPLFFVYDYMDRRSRFYPPLRRHFLSLGTQAVNQILKGYKLAVRNLIKKNILREERGLLRVDAGFVQEVLSSRFGPIPLPKVIENFIRARVGDLRTRLHLVTRRLLSVVKEELSYAVKREGRVKSPASFLFLPTEVGLASLEEEVEVKSLVKRLYPSASESSIRVSKIVGRGLDGMFNSLYRVDFYKRGARKSIAVKKFNDWANFKWFPVALYSLGTQTFAVLGHERMAKEYVFNKLLRKTGFRTPNILHINWRRKLLFQEFIDGEPLTDILRQLTGKQLSKEHARLARQTGSTLAKVHGLGIALGDCKPDNFIVIDGDICLVDLEQARRGGDPSWDVAEFLYMSTRHLRFGKLTESFLSFAKSFMEGYVNGGGSPQAIVNAGCLKYTKIFSAVVLPTTLLTLSRVCREFKPKSQSSES